MDTFPRPGHGLSPSASIRYPNAVYERPGLIVAMDNGVKQRRTLGRTGRFKAFTISCVLNQADTNTVFAFLNAQDLFAKPFTLIHPYWGTGTVNYALTELPLATPIEGDSPWFQFDLQLEGNF